MRPVMYKRSSHNIYLVSISRTFRNETLTELKELFKQLRQKKLIGEFVGDCIGAASLVILLYVGLFLPWLFQ
jgi:hypothetical protein